jgi:hypothetical protein
MQEKLFHITPPAKRLNGSGKISKQIPSVVSEQRNFVKCPNSSTNSYILDNKTGKTFEIGCGRWDCPVCGEKKMWRLKKAIFNCIKSWERVRMMTLTVSSNYSESREQHYMFLQECWRRFITELRRTKSLRKDQRNFQFIRVPEEHQSGYMHMHCLVDSFLEVKTLFTIWQHIIHETSKDPFLAGSVVMSTIPSAADGARYLSKYISKLLSCESYITRRYSKSGEIVLFIKKDNKGRFSFCFGVRPSTVDENYEALLDFFTCQNKDTSSQEELSINDYSRGSPEEIATKRRLLEQKIANGEYDFEEKAPTGFRSSRCLN